MKCTMEGLTRNLLRIYVFTETIRASYEFYSLNTTSGIAPALTLVLANVLELAIASLGLYYCRQDVPEKFQMLNAKDLLQYAIPAGLDLLSTFFYNTALPFTSPFLLQAFMITNLPATAILYHFQVQKQWNVLFWSSLVWSCLGLLIFKAPPMESHSLMNWTVAVLAGSVIGLVSGVSSISGEKLLKRGSLWESQFWLYLWRTILSIFAYPARRLLGSWVIFTNQSQPKGGYLADLSTSILLAIPTAAIGIIVAVILRRRNNLARCVGTEAGSLVATVILSYVSKPFRTVALTRWSIVGFCVAVVSLWHFDSHQLSPERDSGSIRIDYQALLLEEMTFDEELEAESSEEARRDCEGRDNHRSSFLPQDQKNCTVATMDAKLLSPALSRISLMTISDAATFGLVSRIGSLNAGILIANALSLGIFLLPSFVRFRKKECTRLDRKIHPTDYLDGIRGVAAFSVFLCHTFSMYYPRVLLGWNGTTQNLFFQLPLIRYFISGHPMVATFFVVSGFSISYSPLKRIGSKDFEGFSTSLASSVFRRHLRLFLPCAVVSFSSMLFVYTGADQGRLGVPQISFLGQIEDWFVDFVDKANPTAIIRIDDWTHTGQRYAAYMWTIPVEFRGSMVVYILLFASARMPAKIRICLVTFLAFFWGYYTLWDLMLFSSGVILADMHLLRAESTMRLKTPERSQANFAEAPAPTATKIILVAKKCFWVSNFLLAIYILSMQGVAEYPLGGGDPGYVFLWSLTPAQYTNQEIWYRFWPAIGSIYLVFTIDNCTLLQNLYTLRFAQYLGYISFALYLVHPTILAILGMRLIAGLWLAIGSDTSAGADMAFCIGFVIIVISTIWVADVFTRAVDENCVKFSRWVYNKFLDANF